MMSFVSVEERNFGQDRFASFSRSGWIVQTPSTETGAVRARPLFNTPTSPNRGSATRVRYATAKWILVRFIQCSRFWGKIQTRDTLSIRVHWGIYGLHGTPTVVPAF